MSLLIEGMGMLKYKPEDSLFTQYPTCICVYPDSSAKVSILIQQDDGIYKRDPNDYQVRGISTPHGDLIDRDDLLAYFDRKAKGKTAEEALKLLYTALKAYPTVIEKENTQ